MTATHQPLLDFIETQFAASPTRPHLIRYVDTLIVDATTDNAMTDTWWHTICRLHLDCWYATATTARTLDLPTLHSLIKSAIDMMHQPEMSTP